MDISDFSICFYFNESNDEETIKSRRSFWEHLKNECEDSSDACFDLFDFTNESEYSFFMVDVSLESGEDYIELKCGSKEICYVEEFEYLSSKLECSIDLFFSHTVSEFIRFGEEE